MKINPNFSLARAEESIKIWKKQGAEGSVEKPSMESGKVLLIGTLAEKIQKITAEGLRSE